MQAVKSKGSKIEALLGNEMWKKGLRYRKNDKSVYGKPDFTFKKYKIAFFATENFGTAKIGKQKSTNKRLTLTFGTIKLRETLIEI